MGLFFFLKAEYWKTCFKVHLEKWATQNNQENFWKRIVKIGSMVPKQESLWIVMAQEIKIGWCGHNENRRVYGIIKWMMLKNLFRRNKVIFLPCIAYKK